MIFVILVLLIIAIAVCLSCLCIVPQGNAWVIERLGKYNTIWYAGLHIRTPVLERIARKISLKEQVADFEPQSVITKDNVTMMVDSIVFFQIMDPKLLTYGVERPIAAIENLSATTLRNIIGELSLDDTLSGTVTNTKLYDKDGNLLIQRQDVVPKPEEKNLLVVFQLELREVAL